MATTGPNAPVVPSTGEEPVPYKEQQPFLGLDRPYYGFISGSGAGKTFAGVYRLWCNATMWNPNSMGAIIVPDKSQFTDNVKPIMEEFGLMDRWEYKSVYTDEPGLVTENGQRILILSADNQKQIGRIKGKNLAYIWMDEEAEIPPRAREIADQRLRIGNYPNLFITTTPDGYNHTYDFFKGDRDFTEEMYGEATLVTTDESLAVVGVPSDRNPALEEGSVERMRRNLPENIVAQEIEGQFVEVGSGVYQKEMFEFVHPENLDREEDHFWQTVIAVDPAIKAESETEAAGDYWAITVLRVDTFNGQIYVSDTGRNDDITLQEGVAWLSGVFRQAENAEMIVESNQAQRWLAQELAKEGINVKETYSTRDKEARLIDLSIPISSGTVKFIDWNADDESEVGKNHPYETLVQEALAFPEGSHDDQLDSLYLGVDSVGMSASQSISSHEGYDREDRNLE